MHWNYRVIRSEEGGETSYAIHEVHYDDNRKIMGWGGPTEVLSQTRRGLLWTLAVMAMAIGKPVLEERENEKLVEIEPEQELPPTTLQFIEHAKQIKEEP